MSPYCQWCAPFTCSGTATGCSASSSRLERMWRKQRELEREQRRWRAASRERARHSIPALASDAVHAVRSVHVPSPAARYRLPPRRFSFYQGAW